MDRTPRKIFFFSIVPITCFLLLFPSTSLVLSGHQAEGEVKAEVVSRPLASSLTNDTLEKILLSKQALKKKLSEEEKDLKKEKAEARQEAIRTEIQE
ncbi:MAG: hypothetical protein WBM35_13975, partial [Candidatus Electrothrix sp.]